MMIFFLLFLMIQSANAMSPEEIRSVIQDQASRRHPNPPPDFWEKLGPNALPVLKKMIEEEVSSVERTWLIDGLGHFSGPDVGQLLESKIKSSDKDFFTMKLLSSLIRSQGDLALDFVEPYLAHPDPHIRIAVGQGIRMHMSTERAKSRLRQYISNEKESWIQAKIEKIDPVPRNERGGRIVSLVAPSPLASPAFEIVPKALLEQDWAGEWKGVYLSPLGSGSAKGFLKKEKEGWAVELVLPKRKRIELKPGEVEVQYFQTDRYHWIRIRAKKTDTVFTGNRKAN